MYIQFLLMGTILYFAVSGPAEAGTMLKKLFGCTGKICVIHSNGGGRDDYFKKAAWEARAEGVSVVFAGPCGSSCYRYFLPELGGQACVRSTARFISHRPLVMLEKNFLDLPYYGGPEKRINAAQVVSSGMASYCR